MQSVLKLMLLADVFLALLAVLGWYKSHTLIPALIFGVSILVTCFFYFKSKRTKNTRNELD